MIVDIAFDPACTAALVVSMEVAMRIFDHFGHFAHGHGAAVAVGIAVLVAIAMPIVFALSSRKDPGG
jgi:hypothetical protein